MLLEEAKQLLALEKKLIIEFKKNNQIKTGAYL